MELWIIAALGVFLVNIYLPAAMFLPQEGLLNHAGPRDNLPEPAPMAARARRALANMQENLPIFLALALLAMILPETDMGRAILGAQLFVYGRIAYIPLYLFGIPWLRSAAYGVALFGCILILLAIL